MKVKVFAKLNLTLSVGAKQGEFHPIDSAATSVDISDVVEVVKRADSLVKVSGVDTIEQERNTAYKAAVAFRQAFAGKSTAIPGVDICIQKGIPFGGGLGGSSADAAAVVYCMCKLFNVDIHSPKVHELCAALGSDINFMLFGGLGRLTGKGDDVTYCKQSQPLYFALTTFDISMNSGVIYSAFDTLNAVQVNNTERVLSLLQQGANGEAITLLNNDLQQATLSVSSYANDYLDFIQAHNMCCNMTGSGSAYYVACQTAEQAWQVAELLNAHGFTTDVCKSVPNGIIEI
ncbi:MAG: 4-(cytidine 5'-diphospho)-2-C-methyl-D-erythritol kinase [Clostridiales bacterium]|nr:4-(cytidine 5'-diphospho)-2-C-methyl-D-erythritol kinase [Clostridiales bacterium]